MIYHTLIIPFLLREKKKKNIYHFYCEEQNGYYDEIMNYSNLDLEYNHNFIQWLFPLTEKSKTVKSAPVLNTEELKLLCENSNFYDKYIKAFNKMMQFYNLNISEHSYSICYNSFDNKKGIFHWLTPHNHNFLRLTRIIKSLIIFNKKALAYNLFLALEEIYNNFKDDLNLNESLNTSYTYWKDAIKSIEAEFKYTKKCNCLIFTDCHGNLTEIPDYLQNEQNIISLGDNNYNDLVKINNFFPSKNIYTVLGNHDSEDLFSYFFSLKDIDNQIIDINNIKTLGFKGSIKYKPSAIGYTEEEGQIILDNIKDLEIKLILSHSSANISYSNDKIHTGYNCLRYFLDKHPNVKWLIHGHNHQLLSEKYNNTEIIGLYGICKLCLLEE